MRIQGPVFTDFAFQAELLAIGRQQQLDGGGIKADTVVKRLHLMFRIDALDRHHRHQYVFLLNQARIAGEERFDKERLVGNHHVIDPRAGNIDARQIAFVVHQFVDWAITMPSWKAAASTSAGVSSVLGPVYRLPLRSAL